MASLQLRLDCAGISLGKAMLVRQNNCYIQFHVKGLPAITGKPSSRVPLFLVEGDRYKN